MSKRQRKQKDDDQDFIPNDPKDRKREYKKVSKKVFINLSKENGAITLYDNSARGYCPSSLSKASHQRVNRKGDCKKSKKIPSVSKNRALINCQGGRRNEYGIIRSRISSKYPSKRSRSPKKPSARISFDVSRPYTCRNGLSVSLCALHEYNDLISLYFSTSLQNKQFLRYLLMND